MQRFMNMLIIDNKKIKTLQDEFNSVFPYLKIEFFSRSHQPGKGSPKSMIKSPDKTLAECRLLHEGQMSITPSMTVTELEQEFEKIYGLHIQVFRKSGQVWLETSVTDGWTLDMQNKQGESLSNMRGWSGTDAKAS